MTGFPCRHPVPGGRRAPALPVLALIALVSLAGCSTRVSTGPSYNPTAAAAAAGLPRPTRLLVTDFQIDADAVQQDQGIGPRLQRAVAGGDGTGRESLAQEVRAAIGDSVVEAFARSGLPAERVPAGTPPRPGDLVLSGRVLRIDEGNRTRRIGIGFGAGMSIVEAEATLSAIDPRGMPVLLQTYDGRADSGHKPGMAVGASAAVAESSAATGVLSAVTNIGGEVRRSPVGNEAASLGKRLARDVGQYAAGRGWITASAVPAWSR